MLPTLLLYGTLGPKRFLIFCGVPFIVLLFLLQDASIPFIGIILFFLVPSVVMGELYRRKASAKKVVLAGTMTMIGELLLALLGSYAFQYDVVLEMRMMMWESYEQFPAVLKSELNREIMELSITILTRSIPFFMIAISVYYVAITHTIGSRLLRYFKVPAQSFPPIRTWMVPKSLVFYYIVILFLDLFIDRSIDSFLSTVIFNALPLLTIAFMVQALSFILFLLYHKKRTKFWLPVLSVAAFLFFPTIVSMLGVMDALFPIRKRMIEV